MGRLYPGALSWADYSKVVATRRGAVPRQYRLRAEFIFRIERQLRLRLPVVRHRMCMPATLSVWSCALALWRQFTAAPGFDPVSVEEQAQVLVDCLLAVAASEILGMDLSESRFYEENRLLQSDLKACHAADIFDCIARDLSEGVLGSVKLEPHMD